MAVNSDEEDKKKIKHNVQDGLILVTLTETYKVEDESLLPLLDKDREKVLYKAREEELDKGRK